MRMAANKCMIVPQLVQLHNEVEQCTAAAAQPAFVGMFELQRICSVAGRYMDA
jgi:hypothetical protein